MKCKNKKCPFGGQMDDVPCGDYKLCAHFISADGVSDSAPADGCVFSGEASNPLWNEINALDALSTGDDIRHVLYSFGCAMQELEAKLTHNGTKHAND